jgi:hypothetical protein
MQGGEGPAPGAGAGNDDGAPAAPRQGIFALTPAKVSNDWLDYSDTAVSKQFYKAVAPLSPKFDLSSGAMLGFIQALSNRARAANWETTLTVPVDGKPHNLVKHYGSVTLENVKTHALTYVGKSNRNAQNSVQIYMCLSESLTDEAKHKVALDASKYEVNGNPDGLLFFKVIVGIAHVDTRATITVIRTRLSSLDTKMADLQDNVKELNQYVKAQQDGLTARGERTDDLLVNLFKAYRACNDEEFLNWAKRKEDSYNEGTNISPEELMSLADNKYTTLVDAGLWLQKSESQKRIVALTAQVKSWEKVKDHKKSKDTKKDKKGKGGKNKKNKKTTQPDWVTVPPGAGQPQDKDVDGKDWHWCPNHGDAGKWVRHTRDKCEMKKEKDAKSPSRTIRTSSNPMKVSAMMAVQPDDDDF